MPIEAQTSRISFKDECEDEVEKIACWDQGSWNANANWATGIKIIPKKVNTASPSQSTHAGWFHAISIKGLEWRTHGSGTAWIKFDDIIRRWSESYERTFVELNTSVEKEFKVLAEQWRRDTGMLSMLDKKVMHPAYQRIIGMGKEALPLIFRELNERGGHWLWALCAITGEDAAKPEHNLKQAVKAWIEWGKEHGYL